MTKLDHQGEAETGDGQVSSAGKHEGKDGKDGVTNRKENQKASNGEKQERQKVVSIRCVNDSGIDNCEKHKAPSAGEQEEEREEKEEAVVVHDKVHPEKNARDYDGIATGRKQQEGSGGKGEEEVEAVADTGDD